MYRVCEFVQLHSNYISMAEPETAEEMCHWEVNGRQIQVPKGVYLVLKAPYRGQTFPGDFTVYLLSLFHDEAIYVPTLDPTPTCQRNVKTRLVCKYDSNVVLGKRDPLSYGQINPSKILPDVIVNWGQYVGVAGVYRPPSPTDYP